MCESESHEHDKSVSQIRAAFFINLIFTIIEAIGGVLTNSVAILSDALHDLGDSLSLGISWYFENLAEKGKTPKFSYGYRRFSLLGAIINSLVLFAGSVIIIIETVPRLVSPQSPDAEGMIYFAVGGILANGFAAWKLHGGKSLNQRAVYIHLLEDVLGWIAVLVGAILMKFKDWPIIDPILAIAISTFILFNIFKNLQKAIKIILQGTPEEINPKEINRILLEIPKVLDTHDCHIWSMDGHYHILSIHVVVDKRLNMDELSTIKNEAKNRLKANHIDHITIEFEQEGEDCESC